MCWPNSMAWTTKTILVFLDRKEGVSAANLLFGKGGYLYVSTGGRPRKGFYGSVSKLKP